MKTKLRNWQDTALDDGWRIKFISHGVKGRPMTFGFETWSGYVALSGVITFLSGVGYSIYEKEHHRTPFGALLIAIAGLAIAASSIKLRDYLLKRHWTEKKGRCLDSEIRHLYPGRDYSWDARVLCEYENNGVAILCTPFLSYIGFVNEASARESISKRIDSAGACRLLVNPKNPLEVLLLERKKY
jgi:hypothetical protein